ncbi:hypothetical protein JOL79_30025 [Microbispora sp. RL4-1S]|uniref:Uncharacterized protein n=1 Tax=Microbispora oryzae TaxID=2806554 RepID=A0A941ALC7_9ACTN|nr:hypothetical protein [Microbispora oryzae]
MLRLRACIELTQMWGGQVAGIGAMVVRGTPRDSLYILDTLLNLDGG